MLISGIGGTPSPGAELAPAARLRCAVRQLSRQVDIDPPTGPPPEPPPEVETLLELLDRELGAHPIPVGA